MQTLTKVPCKPATKLTIDWQAQTHRQTGREGIIGRQTQRVSGYTRRRERPVAVSLCACATATACVRVHACRICGLAASHAPIFPHFSQRISISSEVVKCARHSVSVRARWTDPSCLGGKSRERSVNSSGRALRATGTTKQATKQAGRQAQPDKVRRAQQRGMQRGEQRQHAASGRQTHPPTLALLGV